MNKVALITGSSRGLGKSIVTKFAQNNYNVVINYLQSETKALKLKEDLEKDYNINALTIKCDVSNEEEIKNMIEKTYETFGRIDVIVNNAGIAIDTTFEDKTKENFLKTLEVNLIGPFLICKYARKYMNNGSIINIASTNGMDTNYVESMDYDASKAGLISLTKNLAIELNPIRVNAVAPGWINTDMNKDLDKNFKEKEENKIILKRFASPEEIANVVYFLSSDEASYINGSTIRVDGGYNA